MKIVNLREKLILFSSLADDLWKVVASRNDNCWCLFLMFSLRIGNILVMVIVRRRWLFLLCSLITHLMIFFNSMS